MKAIVTIINDYGEVVEKDKVIGPFDEYVTHNPKNVINTKTTVFEFAITEVLNQHERIYIPKKEENK